MVVGSQRGDGVVVVGHGVDGMRVSGRLVQAVVVGACQIGRCGDGDDPHAPVEVEVRREHGRALGHDGVEHDVQPGPDGLAVTEDQIPPARPLGRGGDEGRHHRCHEQCRDENGHSSA